MAELALSYYYSASDPNSKVLADKISASPFGDLISLVNIDNVQVRNYLLYGNYPQSTVPFFMSQDSTNSKVSFYSVDNSFKFFDLAARILRQTMRDEQESSSEITIGGMAPASSRAQVSRILEENSNVPSILK